jgi:hypothetical protein
MAQLLFNENATAPATPSAGQMALYAKTDNNLYAKNPLGVETLVTTGSSITALTGDVVAIGPGSAVATIQPDAVTNTKMALMPAYTVKSNPTSSAANPTDTQYLILGTPVISLLGIASQITGDNTGYFQYAVQNTNAGTGASSDFVVNNNISTDTTYYGDFGINSSTQVGVGSLDLPNATYLYSQNGDLTLGTAVSNAIHLVVNSNSTDSITINSSGNIIMPALTGYLYANGSGAITASTTVPTSNLSGTISLTTQVSGILPIANGGTGQSTQANAITALTGTQHSGYYLRSNGTSSSLSALQASDLTGIVAIADGGTGQSTASAAFNALSPMTTAGDLEYEVSSGTAGRLAIGTNGQVLTVVSGAPAWAAVSSPGFSLQFFGDGSDGNVTISSGTTTLTRDMFYNNLTLNGTGSIKSSGFRIFVSGTLDITAAAAGAITVTGGVGSIGGGGGTAGPVNGGQTGTRSYTTTGSLGAATGGGSGGTGNLSNGGAGNGTAGNGNSNGGNGNSGGTGGAGSVGTGGGGGGPSNIVPLLINRPETQLLIGATLLSAGVGGAGGGGAGGNNSNEYGAGGGGGGAGGGIIFLSANIINRGSGTATSSISAIGGAGGAGGAGSTNCGGGGAGGGAGGGWVYILYNTLSGSTATNCIDVSGGAGGTGGSSGTGGFGGNGGSSGYTGRVNIMNLALGTSSYTSPVVGTAGSAASGTTGGAGAVQNTSQVSL